MLFRSVVKMANILKPYGERATDLKCKDACLLNKKEDKGKQDSKTGARQQDTGATRQGDVSPVFPAFSPTSSPTSSAN